MRSTEHLGWAKAATMLASTHRAWPAMPTWTLRRWARFALPTLRLAAGLLASVGSITPGRADGVEEFYRGRSVTIAIVLSVGGGYDLYARLLARHLGKHIPGQPNVIAQNREGAGSQRATLYLYNAAPRDGTVIGAFSRSMAVAPLIGD